MPFITEELWHELNARTEADCIIVAAYPEAGPFDAAILSEASLAFDLVKEIRNTRNTKNLSPKEPVLLLVKKSEGLSIRSFWPVIRKLANLSAFEFVGEPPAGNATSFLVRSFEFYIPLEGKVDQAKEREAIQKEIEYQKGFLAIIDKKLSNEKFVNSAPAQVVDIERKKKADAEAKINALKESLTRINL
jgi:valyl-tRNA synthetase